MRASLAIASFTAALLSLAPPLAARAGAAIACETSQAEFPAPFYSVLASKIVSGNQLWLAVLACRDKNWIGRRAGDSWKFRRIDLGKVDVARIRVSADGTRVYLYSAEGTVAILDLTRGESVAALKWSPQDRAPQQAEGEGVERLLLSSVPKLPHNSIVESELTKRLELEDPSPSARGQRREEPDDTLTGGPWVVESDPQPNPVAVGVWGFTLLELDQHLYFPVLQFADRESVWPSPVTTLQSLVPGIPQPDLARTNEKFRDQVLYGAYVRDNARQDKCTSYVHVVDMQGSWLLEFWLYYPFDVGGFGPHLHDSEHVFVEVSKLGGFVRRVVGAGHGPFAGNNIYDATKPGAYFIYLPTFSFVELGKHATAPNLDRNGTFTPGLDENWYSERARIWGVRDVIGSLNNQLLMFDSTMMVDRNQVDALGLLEWRSNPKYADLVANAQLAPEQCVCTLQTLDMATPLPPDPCDEVSGDLLTAPTSEACALSKLTRHTDARNPVAAFKDWYFPPVTGRILGGVGPGEHTRVAGAALTTDLKVVPLLKKLSLPGRLTTRGGYWQRPGYVEQKGDIALGHRKAQGFFVGSQYEQFLTNIFGGYFSGTYLDGDRTMVTTDGEMLEEDTVRGMWFGIGIVAEIPLSVPGARIVSTNIGMAFRQGSGTRLEFSISLGLTKFGWGHHYGVRAGDPPQQ